MSDSSSTSAGPRNAYAVPERALQRWVLERLRRQERAGGRGAIYSFALSGSTCNSIPLEVVMTVVVGADGRIERAAARPAAGDGGCAAMCAVMTEGSAFLDGVGDCGEAVGLTLEQAAFGHWDVETSGCFCTAGHRAHKWRNVFQALHYAETHRVP